MNDADVIIAGAGPAGLMLASELRLAGVRPLVLERQKEHRDVPKANGLGGQILELLRYRGVLARLEAAGPRTSHVAARYPFGGVHIDLSNLADPPLRGITLPQAKLERLLEERAVELGVDVSRGHEIVGVSQDEDGVTVEVRGPDGTHQVTAAYLVGCDGGRSSVRQAAGIPFPGPTYPEVNRLGQVTLAESITRLENGDLDVPGLGRMPAGAFTRTERGVFGFGWLTSEVLMVSTTEDQVLDLGDDEPMTLTELEDSIERVLGVPFPLGEPQRLSRYLFHARLADRYRSGRILLAGDAAHLFPATGVGLNAGMFDAVNLAWKLAAAIHGWAPAGLLESYHDERRHAGERTMLHTQAQVALRRGQDPAAEALREVFMQLVSDEQPVRRVAAMLAGADIRYAMPNPNGHALTGTFAPDLALRSDGDGVGSVAELMRKARPILLDLADRADLREVARAWAGRVDVHSASSGERPADALLIRPDAQIAWAATVDEPSEDAAAGLDAALRHWFGAPT